MPFVSDDGPPRVSDERLNAIYNACDVGINTSAGEGWGLVAFEHAATGAPQIVPDNSVCSELWQNAASLLPCTEFSVELGIGRATSSAEEVRAALERLYADGAHYERLSSACFTQARAEKYQWEAIMPRWDELIRGLAHNAPSTGADHAARS